MSKVDSAAGKLPPFKISRKLPSHPAEREAMRRHARQVGEIVYAWNSTQGALFWVFWTMLGRGQAVAHGMWHSVQSDTTQRKMLAKLATQSEEHSKTIRRSVLWATRAMDELSSYRNDAAHVQMFYHYDQITPSDVTSREAALIRLSRSPVETYWQRLRGDLRALESYAMDLHISIMMKSARPISHRPKLRLVKVKAVRVE